MRRLFARMVSIFVALQLLWGAGVAFDTGVRRIREGWRHRGDDGRAAMVRIRGASYADAVEAIRARIPPDGSYLLVDEGKAPAWVDMIWLRFDLAPRKAQYLGWLLDGKLVEERSPEALLPSRASYPGLRRAALRNLAAAPAPPFVVVLCHVEGAMGIPRIEDTAAFLAAHPSVVVTSGGTPAPR